MFQFPSLPRAPYVFRYASQRITTGGFPHSEISGSKVGQHLTRAYRSRPRPSSALGAKASTVCPYSLDREELIISQLWSFQGAREPSSPNVRTPARVCRKNNTARPVSQNSTANVISVEVDVDLGEPDHGRKRFFPSTSLAATSSNCYWDP
jgi:hypothetical protein